MRSAAVDRAERMVREEGLPMKEMSGLPKVSLLLLPMEPGRKTRHLALLRHKGGGWYEVECMGQAKRCRAGECKHTARMRLGASSGRPIKQVARP